MKQAAVDIRGILEALGLQSWPLLSGGKGVHVVVPLVPKADWAEAKGFCQDLAELLARTEPSRFVANMSKARRKGRMFLDYLRNGQGSTAICPWSTRARPGAPVPCRSRGMNCQRSGGQRFQCVHRSDARFGT